MIATNVRVRVLTGILLTPILLKHGPVLLLHKLHIPAESSTELLLDPGKRAYQRVKLLVFKILVLALLDQFHHLFLQLEDSLCLWLTNCQRQRIWVIRAASKFGSIDPDELLEGPETQGFVPCA